MSEAKKVLQLGRLPQKELKKLTNTDNTVLATALIYSILKVTLVGRVTVFKSTHWNTAMVWLVKKMRRFGCTIISSRVFKIT